MTARVVLLGCGNIAASHVQSLRSAGLDVAGVVGSPGSVRAPRFAAEHGIGHVFSDVDEVAGSTSWDAAVVATSVESTLAVCRALLPCRRPMLVEKPVGLTSEAVAELLPASERIVVGYNRRFYDSVQAAKAFVDRDGGHVIAEIVIPEAIPPSGRPAADDDRLRMWFANSVHVLDLSRYLLGDLEVAHVLHRVTDGSPRGSANSWTPHEAAARSTRRSLGDESFEAERLHLSTGLLSGTVALLHSTGATASLIGNWNAPDNFRITLSSVDERLELRPLEVAHRYRGTELTRDEEHGGLKVYRPVEVETVGPAGGGKPGFEQQAVAFAGFVDGGACGPAARVEDAVAALALAEQLVSRPWR
jgi:predicted dehydrogenase